MSRIEATDTAGGRVDLDDAAERVVRGFLDIGAAARKVVLVGNGGSASIAGHMEMDLCNRVHIRATVFNDPPVLTALANDHGYASAFERLVGLWAEEGDCLVAISSSGASESILRAIAAARERRCAVVTLSGFEPDNPLRALGDVNFYVASREYGEVEIAHHALGHYLTDRAAGVAASGG
jgi:D-sedoheptulose 7-phosphate isomerase